MKEILIEIRSGIIAYGFIIDKDSITDQIIEMIPIHLIDELFNSDAANLVMYVSYTSMITEINTSKGTVFKFMKPYINN